MVFKFHKYKKLIEILDGDTVNLVEPVQISKEDIEAAFKFFDIRNRKKITIKDLRTRLKAFYPHMSNREFKLLISEPNFTIETLTKIVNNPIATNFDPVKEAFKVYDPHDTGYVNTEILRGIMKRLGYDELNDEDMKVLIQTADVDGDGKISLEDFRQMTNQKLKKKDISPETI